MYVLDAFTGGILHILCHGDVFFDCQFVSDEECAIGFHVASTGYSLGLFNVESGDLLSMLHLESNVNYLAVCPRKRLLAIGQMDYPCGLELIHVHLP